MKTAALTYTKAPQMSLVAMPTAQESARIVYGVNGYSRIKEIFSIKPACEAINELQLFMNESEKNDPCWFSSYE